MATAQGFSPAPAIGGSKPAGRFLFVFSKFSIIRLITATEIVRVNRLFSKYASDENNRIHAGIYYERTEKLIIVTGNDRQMYSLRIRPNWTECFLRPIRIKTVNESTRKKRSRV